VRLACPLCAQPQSALFRLDPRPAESPREVVLRQKNDWAAEIAAGTDDCNAAPPVCQAWRRGWSARREPSGQRPTSAAARSSGTSSSARGRGAW
jgi:hypothetical protein